MLTSLFGDLGPPRNPERRLRPRDPQESGFVATPIMETVATGVNARGQMVDRYSRDLVVIGSPAQAIREHFSNTRSDLETAASLITLLDPAGVWAAAVIKALSDAGGRPIERLHLREQGTLRTLATIERTTLVRRHHDTLRIYHADVRAPGRDNAEIPVALMERSQMTTVIVGPLQPHAIDDLLQALLAAAMLPTWRCPTLLFVLPPNAVWIANKIGAIAWPARLHVDALSESMSSASSVWNAMLGRWNQAKAQPGWTSGPGSTSTEADDAPLDVGEAGDPAAPASGHAARPGGGAPDAVLAAPAAAGVRPRGMRIGRNVLDPASAREALAALTALDGLLGCAVVDASTGLVLARDSREPRNVDIDMAAAASAQALRAHRQAARSMGLAEQVEEVITSAGARQHIMRTVSAHPDLFLLVLLDKHHNNLAPARFQLMEVERSLV